jgi:hypothetical protein
VHPNSTQPRTKINSPPSSSSSASSSHRKQQERKKQTHQPTTPPTHQTRLQKPLPQPPKSHTHTLVETAALTVRTDQPKTPNLPSTSTGYHSPSLFCEPRTKKQEPIMMSNRLFCVRPAHPPHSPTYHPCFACLGSWIREGKEWDDRLRRLAC